MSNNAFSNSINGIINGSGIKGVIPVLGSFPINNSTIYYGYDKETKNIRLVDGKGNGTYAPFDPIPYRDPTENEAKIEAIRAFVSNKPPWTGVGQHIFTQDMPVASSIV